jgi:hypothetical protein
VSTQDVLNRFVAALGGTLKLIGPGPVRGDQGADVRALDRPLAQRGPWLAVFPGTPSAIRTSRAYKYGCGGWLGWPRLSA